MKMFLFVIIFISQIFFIHAMQLSEGNVSPNRETADQIIVIPTPLEKLVRKGNFRIDENTTLVVKNVELQPIAKILIDLLYSYTGFKIRSSNVDKQENCIILNIDKQLSDNIYIMDVTENIEIYGINYKAVTNATATLIQLVEKSGNRYQLPKLKIKDAPVHQYRAVLLDVARFWQPIETIYETIDLMWFYKMRYLQLHLTDDQIFTLPLDNYPKLQVTNSLGQRLFYTKEELTDLVEYAKIRGVTIIPEIELPGHSGQLWRTYPEIFGSVNSQSGKPEELKIINIAKEKTYSAIEGILEEVATIFYTSPYIHIGADEVNLSKISQVPEYKEYVSKHNLIEAANGNAEELYCHFINRTNIMVKNLGKKTLVWEGFHNTGAGSVIIDKDITVMVFNTTYNHPKNLLDKGYSIINTTWVPWYLVGAMNFVPETESAYNWNIGKWAHWNPYYPTIQLKDTTNILGAQLTFWEQTHEQVIPLLREKIPLISEKLWSPQSFNIITNQKAFENIDLKYQTIFRPILVNPLNLINKKDQTFTDSVTISMSSLQNGKIRYQFSKDWELMDLKTAEQYDKPFQINESGVLTAQAYDPNNEPIGYKVQEYFTKIIPAYKYKLYGYPPLKGWQTLPTSDTLQLIREGYIGKMNEERLKQINRRLFSKVRPGHIDTRLYNQYNPYLLELSGNIEISKSGKYSIELQTYDGLAEIYVDNKSIAKGENFKDSPEYFTTDLSEGVHKLIIKYYFRNIRNRLSIKYRNDDMQGYASFENLVKNKVKY